MEAAPKEHPNLYVKKVHDFQGLILPYNQEKNDPWLSQAGFSLPLAADLGSGAGNFVNQAARLRPDIFWVGLERRFKRLVKSAEKAQHQGLKNVCFVQAQIENLRSYFHPESLDFCSVQFPDPWPKRKQQKNRYLLAASFLTDLFLVLKPAGIFFVKSDHPDYSQKIFQACQEHTSFLMLEPLTTQPLATEKFFPPAKADSVEADPLRNLPAKLETEFEGIFKHKTPGAPFYSFVFQKPSA